MLIVGVAGRKERRAAAFALCCSRHFELPADVIGQAILVPLNRFFVIDVVSDNSDVVEFPAIQAGDRIVGTALSESELRHGRIIGVVHRHEGALRIVSGRLKDLIVLPECRENGRRVAFGGVMSFNHPLVGTGNDHGIQILGGIYGYSAAGAIDRNVSGPGASYRYDKQAQRRFGQRNGHLEIRGD